MHAPALATSPIEPEPVWDIALLYPGQGCWGEREYLSLETNHFVEFTDGYVEVLPMPTTGHQDIVMYLYHLLYEFAKAGALGKVCLGPTKVRLRQGQVREPDIFMLGSGRPYRQTKYYYEGAVLAIEVVSEDPRDHDRDWNEKRQDYAHAGIPEYWIVDPQVRKIVVLKLVGEAYETHTEAGETGRVASALLPGFEVDAAAVWAAAKAT